MTSPARTSGRCSDRARGQQPALDPDSRPSGCPAEAYGPPVRPRTRLPRRRPSRIDAVGDEMGDSAGSGASGSCTISTSPSGPRNSGPVERDDRLSPTPLPPSTRHHAPVREAGLGSGNMRGIARHGSSGRRSLSPARTDAVRLPGTLSRDIFGPSHFTDADSSGLSSFAFPSNRRAGRRGSSLRSPASGTNDAPE